MKKNIRILLCVAIGGVLAGCAYGAPKTPVSEEYQEKVRRNYHHPQSIVDEYKCMNILAFGNPNSADYFACNAFSGQYR